MKKSQILLIVGLITCFQYSTIAQNEENTIYTGPIIDMHIHAFGEGSGFEGFLGMEYVNPLTGKMLMAVNSFEEMKAETFARFEKHNIVKAMVSQGEIWVEDAPETILIGDSHMQTVDWLRKKHAEGRLQVIGEVAPNYDGILPTDSSLVPYFDLAEELGIPMAYHMYPGGPPGGAYFAYPKTRAFQAKPLQLEEVLFSRPTMKIYIMHAGWPYLDDMKALMYAHPQVYVDIGVIAWIQPRKEFHHFLKGLVDAGYGDRIMFGSDQMVWPQTIDETVDAVNSADFLTLEQKEDIFYDNAATFLGLSEEEIKEHKGK